MPLLSEQGRVAESSLPPGCPNEAAYDKYYVLGGDGLSVYSRALLLFFAQNLERGYTLVQVGFLCFFFLRSGCFSCGCWVGALAGFFCVDCTV